MASKSPEAIARQKAAKAAYCKRPEVRERRRLRRLALIEERRAAGLLPPKKIGRPKGVAETKPRAKRKPKHKQKPLTINPAMNAPVHVPKAKPANFKDQPAIVPAGLKVQKLPGCPTRARFEPPKWFKGEFVREFERLTGAATTHHHPRGNTP